MENIIGKKREKKRKPATSLKLVVAAYKKLV